MPTRLGGLIPAHAGKTYVFCVTCWGLGAHPRSRGENFDNVGKDIPFTGSSPLTRGKPSTVAHNTLSTGLIPAHAGKTRQETANMLASRAHPRSRGENTIV